MDEARRGLRLIGWGVLGHALVGAAIDAAYNLLGGNRLGLLITTSLLLGLATYAPMLRGLTILKRTPAALRLVEPASVARVGYGILATVALLGLMMQIDRFGQATYDLWKLQQQLEWPLLACHVGALAALLVILQRANGVLDARLPEWMAPLLGAQIIWFVVWPLYWRFGGPRLASYETLRWIGLSTELATYVPWVAALWILGRARANDGLPVATAVMSDEFPQ